MKLDFLSVFIGGTSFIAGEMAITFAKSLIKQHSMIWFSLAEEVSTNVIFLFSKLMLNLYFPLYENCDDLVNLLSQKKRSI